MTYRRWARIMVLEQNQSSPASRTKCRRNITVLDTNRVPMAFIEIIGFNHPSNSYRVAEELNIPLFTILSPHQRSLLSGLQPSRAWWDFDPALPEDTKRRMYFMEQAAVLGTPRGRTSDAHPNLTPSLDKPDFLEKWGSLDRLFQGA